MMSQCGAMMAEVGPAEEAAAMLQAAIAMQPDGSHENYLCVSASATPCTPVVLQQLGTRRHMIPQGGRHLPAAD